MKHENKAERPCRRILCGHKSNRLIGWTYEADQTAIQEAQQKVEDLEIERTQEDIQYLIDELQIKKDFLDALQENERLQRIEEIISTWTQNNKVNLNKEDLISALTHWTSSDNKEDLVGDMIDNAVSNNAEAEKENRIKALEEAKSAYDKYVSAKNETQSIIDKYGEGSVKHSEQISKVNELYDKWVSAVDTAKQLNPSENEIESIFGEGGASSGLDYSNVSKDEAFLATAQVGLGYVKKGDNGQILETNRVSPYNSDYGISNTKGGPSNLKGYKHTVVYDTNLPVDASLEADLGGKYFKHTYYLMYDPNKGNFNGQEWAKANTKWKNVQDAVAGLSDYSLLYNTDSYDAADFVLGGKAYRLPKDKGFGFAEGTYSAPGGIALINEEGTEGIITPQGTLTALPSRTGVVPAELTKNLYALGEVAPNLIRELDSRRGIYNNSSLEQKTDNSTHIGNLYATFEANENFDFDEFLRDVRGVISTSKNN